jgi:serine/threonine protein kinase
MAAVTTSSEFMRIVRRSGVLDEKRFAEKHPNESELPESPSDCAALLIKEGFLTQYQAKQLLVGKFKGFRLGTYKILQPLGQGGMGMVFLGEHLSLKRKIAIKVLPTDKAQEDLSLERFQREARAVAALDHPNIVRLHDISQGAGVHFLVMEYVEGTDLQSFMTKSGALHYMQAVQYIAQAAAGLQHAHEKGFVHRDIKPSNLMLTKEGTIKILDMGLARSFVNEEDNLTGRLGEEAEIAGTVDYTSPEQALGMRVDERSDIYSLGTTLFTLVTGQPPYRGSTTQKLAQHQMAEPPRMNKLKTVVPEALTDVVAKMMAKKPSNRYQSMGDVIDALGPWLPAPTTGNIVHQPMSRTDLKNASSTRNQRKKSTKKKIAKRSRNDTYLIGGLVAGVLLIVGMLIAFMTGKNESKNLNNSPPVANNISQPKTMLPPITPPSIVNTPYDRSLDGIDALIGHWRFNLPATKEIQDESPHGQTAIIEGTIDWSRTDGKPGLRFSGNGGIVRVPDHPRMRFKRTESFTLSIWVKPPETLVNGAWQGVVTKPRGRADGWYGIWLANINGERYWVYGSTFRGDNMANLTGCRVIDDWQHVTIVQNAALNTRRIYVDGIDVTSEGRPGPAKDSDGIGDLLIGGATILDLNTGSELPELFRGAISEVKLYSRALSLEEILKASQERE